MLNCCRILQVLIGGCLLGISLAQIPYSIFNKKWFVESHGYPFQTHTVVTTDGYILELDRMPYGNISVPLGYNISRPVAFLMHETWGDSGSWIAKGPSNGLAFLLAERGYDVWMGNSRGSFPSRKHLVKNPAKEQFWDFSLQELAVYDLDAMVQYVLRTTGANNMTYFGHSQGATLLLILVTEKPEYNNVFKGAVLIAPTAYLSYTESCIKNLIPLLNFMQGAASTFKIYEFLPFSPFNQGLVEVFCRPDTLTLPICNKIFSSIWGRMYDNNMNYSAMAAAFPTGSSIKLKWQILQYMSSGRFAKFDYGVPENTLRYGSLVPPAYNLSKFNTQIILYSGGSDAIVTAPDITKLAYELKNTYLQLIAPDYNHLDLLFADDVGVKFYKTMLDLIPLLNFVS